MTGGTVSLDGYIAGPNETGFEHLFAWMNAGDVEYPSANPEVSFRLTVTDHAYFADFAERAGAFVIGRRLFDLTDGWGGRHPFDKPVVVVTHRAPQGWLVAHPGAPFTFVTDGIPVALQRARALAGDRDVVVTAGKIASQCLELGLLDEVAIDLAPILLGGGVRYLEPLRGAPILLDGPTVLVPGERVTHLRYTVRRA
ncbi:MAG TPA: dihydrofolate reductase family protein [Candidatus Binatus sp.]|nr:dihydrofolate reductase family protein [Candidatus Binatus sp.]